MSGSAIVQAPDWTGPSYQTCMDAAAVARRFQTSRRREGLGFTHHREVAALPPEQAERVGAYTVCRRPRRPTRAVEV